MNKISHKAFGQEKDLIGRVYEYFLREFAINATKEEGEFYTPHDVVQLIASMIEPYDGTLYEQALTILRKMNESRESFRKIGLTFEEKAFYDILIALRDQYNFEYGTDKETDGIIINDKCKALAKKVKEIIDTKSSFADWLNNKNVRNQLKLDIKICLVKNGYPPQYSPEVFSKVMEQVENFEEYSGTSTYGYADPVSSQMYQYASTESKLKVAEESARYR